ncbi:MAG: hypothetical protein ACRD1P_13245 [Thermoanaerobaculia bacterium]
MASSLLLAAALERLGRGFASRLLGRVLQVALVAATLSWPFRVLLMQIRDWRGQPLVKSDQWQYVSGWPAGSATQEALADLRVFAAREGPIVVVTNHVAGVPTDAIWLYLEKEPGISLYFVDWMDRLPILYSPSGSDWFLFRSRFHHFDPATRMVRVPSDLPVLFVSMEQYRLAPEAPGPVEGILARLDPRAQRLGRYSNPESPRVRVPDRVVLYRLH